MKKRLKFKKTVWFIFIIILFLSLGLYAGLHIYQDYKYKQTINYKLLEYGYNPNEVEELLKVFNTKEEQEYLPNIKQNSQIISLIQEKYFIKNNFKDYLTYLEENKNLELKEIIRNVNIHLNHNFYEYNLKTDDSLEELMLVNKYYYLSSEYNPDDLVTVSQKYAWGDVGSKKVRQAAYDAFLNMWNAAYQDGYYLMINSAYRTFAEQESLYENRKKTDGIIIADKMAARSGYSEHQTGLAMDIFSKYNSNQKTFGSTEEANWLKNNAYKYGFILRYPLGLEKITGYEYEPWHYRYVGIKAATYIYENNITFEEYYAYFIENS